MQFNYRYIWKMSFPILISMLMQQLIGIADVIFLGRLGEIELGASALGATWFFTIFMVSFGFSVGAQIIMARRNGEGDYAKIGEVFYQGCAFLIVTALAVIWLSARFSPWFLKFLIENPQIYEATAEYIYWRVPGLVAASLILMARGFFVSITTTFVLTFVSLIMVLSNVVLNYILIFGKFGFPAMGIAGAAIASDLAEIIALAAFVLYFIFRIDLKKYGLNRFVYKNFKLLKAILNVSIWTMIQQFISISTWFLFFIAIEHLGEQELAVANILRSLSSFPFVVINAMAAAAGSITSNLIGQNDCDGVMPACFKVIRLGAVIVLPMLVLMAVFVHPLLLIYTDNSGLIAAAHLPYMVMLSSFIPLLPGWVMFNAVSGTGNTRYAMAIELLAMVGYVLHVCIIILYLKLPLSICWTADWVYNLLVLLLAWHYMLSQEWRDRRI